jgi:hypothetical protein
LSYGKQYFPPSRIANLIAGKDWVSDASANPLASWLENHPKIG